MFLLCMFWDLSSAAEGDCHVDVRPYSLPTLPSPRPIFSHFFPFSPNFVDLFWLSLKVNILLKDGKALQFSFLPSQWKVPMPRCCWTFLLKNEKKLLWIPPPSHAPISPLWTDQHWQPAKNQDWQSLESSISSAKPLNGNEHAHKKGKKGAFCRHHTPPFNLEIMFPFHFFLQSSWNNLAKAGPYICWLSLARWSRYIWGHFLFPFYLVCRDLPDKIQYMGHRSNGFHPEIKLSKFNFKLIFVLTINGCRADAYMKMTKYFWKLIMVKIGRLTAAVGERPQRNSRQKRNFLHNLPRIQSLINPLGRKQRRTFSNIFSATYEQTQNKFPLKMVLMMLKHCMLSSILLI